MDKYINAPISDEDAKSLHSGDYVYITGIIYTARDAAVSYTHLTLPTT